MLILAGTLCYTIGCHSPCHCNNFLPLQQLLPGSGLVFHWLSMDSMDCHWVVNGLPLVCQWTATGLSMVCTCDMLFQQNSFKKIKKSPLNLTARSGDCARRVRPATHASAGTYVPERHTHTRLNSFHIANGIAGVHPDLSTLDERRGSKSR